MKIAVVYGAMHKGSTYHCVRLLIQGLSACTPVTETEFFLPQDMPHFCVGCFSCFLNGEQTCPHSGEMKPIADAFDDAELIILASPVYVFDVSGQMKALLDHFGYRWMPHRPSPGMFGKLGLVVSTAAGAGTRRANKTMKQSLVFCGAKRVFSYGKSVGAMSWDEVKPAQKQKIERETAALARRIAADYRKIGRLRPRIFTKFLFMAMQKAQKGNSWNETDRSHWAAQGWLDGKKPW
ncbi:MAG: flavodoxin family protein [Clostridia bacterium]|nr:flavodoxin family protein [Clostridia bacterium]